MTSLQLGFLYMAPWLALLLALAFGRYPGERVLARLRGRRRRLRIRIRSAARVRAPHLVVTGGSLLARRLAGRGPPLTA